MDHKLPLQGIAEDISTSSANRGQRGFPLWYRNVVWGDGQWRIWKLYHTAGECELARWCMATKTEFAQLYQFSTHNQSEDK